MKIKSKKWDHIQPEPFKPVPSFTRTREGKIDPSAPHGGIRYRKREYWPGEGYKAKMRRGG